jgi:hypothetical protein
MSNKIVFKTRQGLNRPTLATLDQSELINVTLLTLENVAPGVSFTVKTQAKDKSHTKAAKQYGGGAVYWHTFRSNTPVTVNRDVVFPQIQIQDRTFSGGSLKVLIGFYRLVCSNGLTVAVGEQMKWSIDHRLSSVEQLRQLSRSIAAAWSKVIEAQAILNAAAQTPVNPFRIIEALPFSEHKKHKLKISLNIARAEDDVSTAYGLYNFLNEQDRLAARRNSTAHLDRDTVMLATILELAAA